MMTILSIICFILIIVATLLQNSIKYCEFIINFLDIHKKEYMKISDEKFAILNKLMLETFDDDQKIIDENKKELLDIELDKMKEFQAVITKFFNEFDELDKKYNYRSAFNFKYEFEFNKLMENFLNEIKTHY